MKRIFLILLSSVVLMIAFTLPFSADVFEGEEVTLYRISTSDIQSVYSDKGTIPYFLPDSSFSCVYVKTTDAEYSGDLVVSFVSHGASSVNHRCSVSESGVVIASDCMLSEVYFSDSASVSIRYYYNSGGILSSPTSFTPVSFSVTSDSLLDGVSSFAFSILDVWGDVVAFVVDPDHLIVLLPLVAWLFVCGCGVVKMITM